jgi:4-nitrophenyl phosphatase/phosphoglycolate phosphatase
MLSSSFAAAHYLISNPLPIGKKAFVIGAAGIEEELALAGIPFVSGSQFNGMTIQFGPGVKLEHDRDIGAVIVGVDTDINYYKIQYAQLCINENEGCKFIATNMDAVAHLTSEQEWACAGAMVGAIRGCTGRDPILVGKPSSLLIDYITNKHKIDRSRVCMVGDRLDTDILFGLQNGLKTVLTLTGVTTEEALLDSANLTVPDYYVDSISDLCHP